MKTISLLFLLLLAACSSTSNRTSALAKNEWLYVLTPKTDGDKPYVHVDLYFQNGADGQTEIHLPNEWAGTKELFRGIKNLTVSTGTLTKTQENKEHRKLLQAKPLAQIKLSYDLENMVNGPLNSESHYYPYITKNLALILGENGLVRPLTSSDDQISVKVEFEKVPSDFKIISSFGRGKTTHFFQGKTQNFVSSLYLIGDFQENSIDVKGFPIYFATKGTFGISLDRMKEVLSKVITGHRDFFNDYQYPHYLISMLSTDDDCCSSGGTGRTNGFATWVFKGFNDEKRLKHLFSHELFHNWNGRKILRQEQEELIYWFSEGFTDYYANRLNIRSGLLTLSEYVDNYNKNLLQYYTSKARNYSNQEILKNFWKDKEVANLPYQQGQIMAHDWNRRIKKKHAGKSFDDFFLHFYKESQINGTIVTPQNVGRVLREYLDTAHEDIKNYMEKGTTIPIRAESLGPCVTLVQSPSYELDYGFNLALTKERREVTGLKSGSPLHTFGVRNGDHLVGWSFTRDPDTEQSVNIEKNGRKVTYSFFARGKSRMVPQYKVIKEEASCLDWFK